VSDDEQGEQQQGEEQGEIEAGIYTVSQNIEIAEIPADAYDPVDDSEGELA
jgi:hypothetical protein